MMAQGAAAAGAVATARATRELSRMRDQLRQLPTDSVVDSAKRWAQLLRFHALRAYSWQLSDAPMLDGEPERLEASGVTSEVAQRYIAWRRSALMVALPMLAVTSLLALTTLFAQETDALNSFGVLAVYVPLLVLIALPFAVGQSLRQWAELPSSSRTLALSWAVVTFLPIAVALAPPSWLIDTSQLAQDERASTLFILGIFLALSYALTLLPVVVSIPAGVMRGCLRVKGLLPMAVLPGWFLVAVAPFYSLLALIAFIVVIQLTGGTLLVLGVALFAFAPWLTVMDAGSYVRPLTSRAQIDRLALTQRRALYLSAGAVVLMLIWAVTTTLPTGANGDDQRLVGMGDSAILQPWDLLRFVVEFAGRALLTAVVFAHVFLSITTRNWRDATDFESHDAATAYHDAMSNLEATLVPSVPAAPPGGTASEV